MESINLKQGQMTVTEVIRKFEKLERLCAFRKLDGEEITRKILERFHPDITIFVEIGGQSTTMDICYERALHA